MNQPFSTVISHLQAKQKSKCDDALEVTDLLAAVEEDWILCYLSCGVWVKAPRCQTTADKNRKKWQKVVMANLRLFLNRIRLSLSVPWSRIWVAMNWWKLPMTSKSSRSFVIAWPMNKRVNFNLLAQLRSPVHLMSCKKRGCICWII